MNPKTLLIIDDEPDARKVLKKILKEEGHRVLTAASGSSGLQTIKRNLVDCVFLDIKMRGWNGIQTLKKMNQLKPGLPIVIVTGYAEPKSAFEAMKLEAYDYIQKPFQISTIRKLLKELKE